MKMLIFIAAAAGATLPVAALAQDRVTARIVVSDINLLSVAGTQEFDRRLQRAARRACSPDYAGALRITPGVEACIAEMTQDGREQRTRLVARTTGSRAAVG